MFVLFGWGKVTKNVVGPVFQEACGYCNNTEIWQLCKNKTWFTLFFIHVIPYSTSYSISCPRCGSYIALTAEQFQKTKSDLNANANNIYTDVSENNKYAGKNDVQV